MIREMVTEKQLANLRPAQKGEVRNPSGKPKGVRSAKIILSELLQTPVDITNGNEKQSITSEEAIWQRAIADAIQGDSKARRDIYDRLEGKPVQYRENTDVTAENPVKIIGVQGFKGWNIPATPEQRQKALQEEIDRLLNEEEEEE